eukprot:scaffold82519_cov37-Phaeocystis_antarctica.AAC.6
MASSRVPVALCVVPRNMARTIAQTLSIGIGRVVVVWSDERGDATATVDGRICEPAQPARQGQVSNRQQTRLSARYHLHRRCRSSCASMPASPRRSLTLTPSATWFEVTGDLLRSVRVVSWIGGGVGLASRRWEVDHGG